MKTIPQRELRNNISRVLRDVEQGERVRVTVDGRPVADLVPISHGRRTFVPWETIEKILREAPLDPGFRDDIKAAAGGTIDELWPPEG
ncbi:MAG TPA: type II toxin-antitoxin system prevent-host-death family antitoxin [Dehalococcoidia bacterium]|nr:type II toxin-antitoxin system prevent-host-death family antitoxin [Dehalococcoidia bacterium]